MKKLLLGFSLIGIFGIGITAASITFPDNNKSTNDRETNKNLEVSNDISINKTSSKNPNAKS
tara:strand:- start:745 stop:930 length:186 start_codon:yes stop_codon:yes gene_type:complete